MTLTFLGNRYQRSEATTDVIPTTQEGMYRGNRYTMTRAAAKPTQTVHLSYRGVAYEH